MESLKVKYNFNNKNNPKYVNGVMINSKHIKELRLNKEKIQSYKNLQHNWNMAGAIPFDELFLNDIEVLLKKINIQPKIFPTGRNSIQFEYEKDNGDYLEFEIFDNKIFCLSIINNDEKTSEFNFDSEMVNNFLNDFYA